MTRDAICLCTLGASLPSPVEESTIESGKKPLGTWSRRCSNYSHWRNQRQRNGTECSSVSHEDLGGCICHILAVWATIEVSNGHGPTGKAHAEKDQRDGNNVRSMVAEILASLSSRKRSIRCWSCDELGHVRSASKKRKQIGETQPTRELTWMGDDPPYFNTPKSPFHR